MPKIHDEIEQGNFSNVQTLLQQGADVNSVKHGLTPLQIAVGRGADDEFINLLLSHGANVNTNDKTGETPLMLAVRQGYCGIVETLLKHGVELEARDKFGCSALMIASAWGMCLNPLLQAGANPNLHNNAGLSPLDFAYNSRKYESVVPLLDAGAQLSETHLIKGKTSNVAVQWLLNDAIVLYATVNNKLLLLEQKLIEGVSADTQREDTSETLLMLASSLGYYDIVRLLVKHNADVNAITRSGNQSVLMSAVKSGHQEIVSFLLNSRADPTYITRSGQTSLSLASAFGRTEIVKLLLKYGIDNNFTLDTSLAINQAQKGKHQEIVVLLRAYR